MAEVCSAILAGNMLLGFAVAAFILPSGVIMGGATGVGIVLGKVIPLDTAGIVLCVNLMAMALGGAGVAVRSGYHCQLAALPLFSGCGAADTGY